MRVEADLHNDAPDVDAKIEYDNGEKTELSSAPLADAFEIENEAEAEAANDAEEGRDERR